MTSAFFSSTANDSSALSEVDFGFSLRLLEHVRSGEKEESGTVPVVLLGAATSQRVTKVAEDLPLILIPTTSITFCIPRFHLRLRSSVKMKGFTAAAAFAIFKKAAAGQQELPKRESQLCHCLKIQNH